MKSLLILFTFLSFSACARELTAPSAVAETLPLTQETSSDCALKLQPSQLCLSWTWEKQPTDRELGSLTFKIFRPNLLDGTPVVVDAEELPGVVLWMASMGHGSSPTRVERVDVGTYRCHDVFFVMPGIWQLRFQIKKGTVVQDEAIDTIRI